MTFQSVKHDYSAVKDTGQIPLCMIGDSITWADFGDHWRKELLTHLPNLAFIGSHTACFGYSHAGEGGDTVAKVLARLEDIPDCPYYHLHIGTNSNSVKEKECVLLQAKETAATIVEIVNGLLAKHGVKKVFLASIMPCYTDNSLRDLCNHETNKILRAEFAKVFPASKVVWVEYEEEIRKVPGWEKIILLHPTPEGYARIAGITAKKIAETLNVKPLQTAVRPANTGVQVVNLLEASGVTRCPIIAGWYTLSFQVNSIDGDNPQLELCGQNQQLPTPFNLTIPVKSVKKRVCKHFYTEAEGYGYTRDYLLIEARNCSISEILLEKMRPSLQSSVYHPEPYIDTVSPCSSGELLEYKNEDENDF